MTTPISHVLGTHSPGHKVLLGDRVYTARPVTQKVKAGFERWLERRVIRGFLTAQDEDDPGLFRRAVEVVADRIAAGTYAFHGDLAQQVLQTTDGSLALASLIFDCSEEEMLRLMTEKGAEVGAILSLVLRESFPGARVEPVETADPNSQGPAV